MTDKFFEVNTDNPEIQRRLIVIFLIHILSRSKVQKKTTGAYRENVAQIIVYLADTLAGDVDKINAFMRRFTLSKNEMRALNKRYVDAGCSFYERDDYFESAFYGDYSIPSVDELLSEIK